MNKSIILNLGTYYIIVDIDEVPFFYELENTEKMITNDYGDFNVYKAPSTKVLTKINELLTDEFRQNHNSFTIRKIEDKNKLFIKQKINKNYVFNNGYYLNIYNTKDGYNFTIYDENKSFINGGTINYYIGQSHDPELIIEDIANFTCYDFLKGNKTEIDTIDFNKINI